jgi:hypothetical protein
MSHDWIDGRGQVSIAKNRSPAICVEDFRPERCPFLALSVHQRAANGSKRRHKAKAENRRIPRVMARDPATSSTRRQRPANDAFSAC